jgi:hypothetical protein
MDLIPVDSKLLDMSIPSVSNSGRMAGVGLDLQSDKVGVLLTPIAPIVGDTNCDEVVDVDDLLQVINSWGDSGGFADLDGSGLVDAEDIYRVILNWS